MCTINFLCNTTGGMGRNNGPNEALEYVQAYIDNLLVITRGTLEDHLAKLKVLKKMHNVGLGAVLIKN
jgi:hypothetical protein